MTERLYYTDSTLLTFKAKVTGIDQVEDLYRVRLDQSAFYPTSGGQLFDTGNLSGARVIDVIEEKEEVFHIVENEPTFKVDDKVSGKIDENRRRDNMQKHTGQHILSRALIEVCDAATVSARLGEDDSTIDVSRENLSNDDLKRAEFLANEAIFQNRPVSIDFVSHDMLKDIPLRKIPGRVKDTYRIITIEDFDWSACGGTHCFSTGSVGIIKITGQEKIRGHQRIHFLTGLKALEDYRWRHDQIEEISNIDENIRLRKKNAELKKQLLPTFIEQWHNKALDINGKKVIALDFSGEDFKEARQAALGIINKYEVVAVIGADDKLLIAVSQGLSLSAADLLKQAADRFGGRGGGSPQLAQGGGFKADDIKVLLAAPGEIFDI
jgi:alanyl-tRNA synthetase